MTAYSRWLIAAGAVVAVLAMLVFDGVFPFGVVLQGAIIGSVTGLLALGLVLVYRTTRVVNFAYGAMGGLAATIGVLLHRESSVPWPLAMLISLLIGIGIGVSVERVVIRRFFTSSRLVLTVATVGLAQVLGGAQALLPIVLNTSPLVPSFETTFSRLRFSIDPVVFTGNDVVIVVVVPLVLAGLSWFLLRTDAGMAVRAIAENVDRAMLLGIPVRKLSTLVWAIVGGLAALTIVVRAPGQGLTLDVAAGPALLLPALAAAVVARMTSLQTAFVSGVALGIVDSLVRWNTNKQAVTTVVFAGVILIALVARRWAQSRAEAADESTWAVRGVGKRLPDALANLPEVRFARFALAGLLAVVAIVFPLVAGPSSINRVSTGLIYGAVALSLVVLTGWGGTVSLSQFAIVGVGGVVAANLIAKLNVDLVLTLVLSGLAGAIIAIVVGLPALRVKGLFLAVTTLAFAVAVDAFFLNPVNFGGWIPPSFDRPVLFKRFDLASERPMYFMCLGLVGVAIAVVRSLRRARTGRVQLATRDNPRSAAAMGVDVVRARVTGFVFSGIIAGLAGALHATLLRGVGFKTYEPSTSLLVFSMAVIGGVASISGALLGVAAVMVAVIAFPKVQVVITGTGLLLVLYALPGGLGQAVQALRDRLARIAGERRGIHVVEQFADGTVSEREEREPVRAAADVDDGALLRCRNVVASYGPMQVLFGVDFDAREGEIVGLLGTNGAGKSTLLRAITNLLESSDGDVSLGGESLGDLPTDETARRGLALMPGGRGLFPTLSVRENLRLACWLLRSDAAAVERATEEALTMFPILRERFPTMAGDLSGGEQQMLSLAMAFVTRPRVLCIDELSLGLAPTVVNVLCDKVREMNDAGTTIVLVEQSVDTALRLAERAVFLEKGEVRFTGPTSDLVKRPDLLRSVFIGSADGSARKRAPSAKRASSNGHSRDVELRCVGVTKRFGGVVALDDVELVVEPGRITGLIGHNGAGKTTLFDVLGGFLPADSGRIDLGGDDITHLPPHKRAIRQLGRSFQEARLYPTLTVAETIAVALELHLANRDPVAAALALPASLDSEASAVERVDELIELLGLRGYRDHHTAELSTGTRRIVELACMLAQDPAVVLLDEPSAGVAQRETEALGPLLRRVQTETGCSMVVIEHDMGLIRTLCDELVALELGQVIATGKPEDVLNHPRVIESYLGSDAAKRRRKAKTRV